MQAVMQIDDKLQLLIDIDDVIAFTRLGKATIYRKMQKKSKLYDASFPRPVDVCVKSNLWRYEDIKAWVSNRPMRSEA